MLDLLGEDPRLEASLWERARKAPLHPFARRVPGTRSRACSAAGETSCSE